MMQQNRLEVLLALTDEIFVVASVLQLMIEDTGLRAASFTLEAVALSATRCQELVSTLVSIEQSGDR